MNSAPILLFQMQRMGDLVLSFPLLSWLGGLFPKHPLWVVGERLFFEPLLPLSPPVTYFDYGEAPDFRGLSFHAVINLSHRPEAAALAGTARSDALFGPYQDAEGRLLIRGDWQLYRASLTHNNRYNLFHWADLNALDLIPTRHMLRTDWPLPRPLPGYAHAEQGGREYSLTSLPESGARIGLFLGASETEKHPDAGFWAILAKRLLQAGHRPVLLGGPAEQSLGFAVAEKLNAHALNLCGHFSVSALARFIGELDLFVTPDTGPMHIAAWTGTPILNLSLGPVNSWETGPFSPGHHVVRAALDCVGCWRCVRETTVCKEEMMAGKIALVVDTLLGVRKGDLASLGRVIGGLELSRTNRGLYGLYELETLFRVPPGRRRASALEGSERATFTGETEPETADARHALALFWKAWFGVRFGRFTAQEDLAAWGRLRDAHPQVAAQLRNSAAVLALALAKGLRGNISSVLDAPDFWKRTPAPLQPLSGYMQMYLQNNLSSRSSLLHALSLLEAITAYVL